MRAACEINFVADVETQADGAEMTFEASAGIKNAGQIVRAQIFNGAYRGSDRGWTIVEEEVVESALHGEKGMEAVVAKFDLGAKESMQNAQIGARESHCRRRGGVVCKPFREDLVKVVAHFGFQHYGFVGMKAKTRANTGEIGFCLGKTEIVGVNAGLNVIVLGERSWRQANDTEK